MDSYQRATEAAGVRQGIFPAITPPEACLGRAGATSPSEANLWTGADTGLENRQRATVREFESHRLRHDVPFRNCT